MDKSLFCVLVSVSVHKYECINVFFSSRCLYAFICSYLNAVVSLVLLERMQLLSLTFSYLIFVHYLFSVSLHTSHRPSFALDVVVDFFVGSVWSCACVYDFVFCLFCCCAFSFSC